MEILDYLYLAVFCIGLPIHALKMTVGILDFVFKSKHRDFINGVAGPSGELGICVYGLWLMYRFSSVANGGQT